MSVSRTPTTVSPTICGVEVTRGGMAVTGPTASEFTRSEPTEFVAVTMTRSHQPYRSAVGRNALEFAPARSKHGPRADSHLFH